MNLLTLNECHPDIILIVILLSTLIVVLNVKKNNFNVIPKEILKVNVKVSV